MPPHFRNYLRVRGEYKPPHGTTPAFSELPPRARRIHLSNTGVVKVQGTTSACAENTNAMLTCHTRSWNYLRVRGEYRIFERPQFAFHGTTSACAENTKPRRRCRFGQWNYLRVRGEYNWPPCNPCNIAELPPRARRIPAPPLSGNHQPGTTSACAENTFPGRCGLLRRWNYLRVRGEYPK